jgi:PEGA domain
VPIVMETPPQTGMSPGTKAAIGLTFAALAVVAGLVAVFREHFLPAATQAAAPVQRDTTPAPPDSIMNVDTTFDLNANSPVSHTSARGRAPVAIDPTLFPAHGTPVDPTAEMPGYIRVIVHGGAARVRVDGHTLGFTPIVVRVEPGPHVVSLESSGDAFLPGQITVNAMPNDTSFAAFTARVAGSPVDTAPPPIAAPPVKPASGPAKDSG